MTNAGEAPDYYVDPDRGMICLACNGVRKAGDWPFCNGSPEGHRPGKYGYDTFGEYVDEHLVEGGTDIGPNGAGEIVQGTRITSREQRRSIMKANNIDWHGRKVGNPGCEF